MSENLFPPPPRTKGSFKIILSYLKDVAFNVYILVAPLCRSTSKPAMAISSILRGVRSWLEV
ncbi:hypothetical protein LguiB_013126 [Lonicera macranthoides]